MGKSKGKDQGDNTALIGKVIVVVASYLLSWWKGRAGCGRRAVAAGKKELGLVHARLFIACNCSHRRRVCQNSGLSVQVSRIFPWDDSGKDVDGANHGYNATGAVLARMLPE